MQAEEKRELKAVHTQDLSQLLQKFNQYDEFVNGQISCDICKDKISKENVGSIRLKSDKLVFTCNKSSCYNKLIKQNGTKTE